MHETIMRRTIQLKGPSPFSLLPLHEVSPRLLLEFIGFRALSLNLMTKQLLGAEFNCSVCLYKDSYICCP